MEFLKGVAGKVITGLIVLAVIAGGVSWWQMDNASRQEILNGTGRILSWLGIVLVLPWASFFLIGKVAEKESNLAGAILVAGYTLIETVLLAWLFHWNISGVGAWTMLIVCGLIAAAYNLFTCDWIAEKVE